MFCRILQSSSDLLGLIQVMIVTFGEMPPVYAKPKEQVTPYPTQRMYRIYFPFFKKCFSTKSNIV